MGASLAFDALTIIAYSQWTRACFSRQTICEHFDLYLQVILSFLSLIIWDNYELKLTKINKKFYDNFVIRFILKSFFYFK